MMLLCGNCGIFWENEYTVPFMDTFSQGLMSHTVAFYKEQTKKNTKQSLWIWLEALNQEEVITSE